METPPLRLPPTPMTFVFLGINVLVFLVAESQGDTTDTGTLLRFGATERGRIWSGEFWRLGTAMFLHVGWLHLAINTIFMYGWCAQVERLMGTARFALLYLATGIGASAVSVLTKDAVSAGASGAGFGIIGVMLALLVRRYGWRGFLRHPGIQNLLTTLAFWIAIGFTMRQIDNSAHLGGLGLGLLETAWLTRAPFRRRRSPWPFVPIVAGTLLLAAAATRPWPWQESDVAVREALLEVVREAAVRHKAGDLRGALELLDRAHKRHPDQALILFLRGLIHRDLGDGAAARRDLERARDLAEGDARLRREIDNELRK